MVQKFCEVSLKGCIIADTIDVLHHFVGLLFRLLADRTATQYDRLLASSRRPSVCPSVRDAGLKVVPACS